MIIRNKKGKKPTANEQAVLDFVEKNPQLVNKQEFFIVTSQAKGEGDLIGVFPGAEREKVRRMCFTRKLKTRKYYYSKVYVDWAPPTDIIKELKKEMK